MIEVTMPQAWRCCDNAIIGQRATVLAISPAHPDMMDFERIVDSCGGIPGKH